MEVDVAEELELVVVVQEKARALAVVSSCIRTTVPNKVRAGLRCHTLDAIATVEQVAVVSLCELLMIAALEFRCSTGPKKLPARDKLGRATATYTLSHLYGCDDLNLRNCPGTSLAQKLL